MMIAPAAVHFRDGEVVRKGQLLFSLDPRPAQAQLAAARAQAGQARTELKRAESLLAAKAISQEEYESRRSAAAVADATLRARRLDVEFTRVTAPIAGRVSARRVDPGNLIAGGTSAGDVLTTIVSADPIHFIFDASEAQLLKLQRQAGGVTSAPVQVRLQDDMVDALTAQIFRELLSYMTEDPHSIPRATRIMFIAKYIERIADHATNIAEMVIYMVEGRIVRHTEPEPVPPSGAPGA